MRFHIKSSSYHHYAYYSCSMPTMAVLCLFISTGFTFDTALAFKNTLSFTLFGNQAPGEVRWFAFREAITRMLFRGFLLTCN